MNDTEKLDGFEQSVYAQARQEAEKIIALANEEADKVIAEAKRRAKLSEDNSIKAFEKKTLDKSKSEISKMSFNAKREILVKRQELVNRLFDKVKQKLCDFTKTEGYLKYLADSFDKIDTDNNVVIEVREEDLSIAKNLFKDCDIKATNEITLGGMRVIVKNSGYMADLSFDEAIGQQYNKFISESGITLD